MMLAYLFTFSFSFFYNEPFWLVHYHLRETQKKEPKTKTLEAPKKNGFFVKMECPPFAHLYMSGENFGLWAYGIKVWCSWEHHWGVHWGLGEHIKNMVKRKKLLTYMCAKGQNIWEHDQNTAGTPWKQPSNQKIPLPPTKRKGKK
jgi:hypothetical protein